MLQGPVLALFLSPSILSQSVISSVPVDPMIISRKRIPRWSPSILSFSTTSSTTSWTSWSVSHTHFKLNKSNTTHDVFPHSLSCLCTSLLVSWAPSSSQSPRLTISVSSWTPPSHSNLWPDFVISFVICAFTVAFLLLLLAATSLI